MKTHTTSAYDYGTHSVVASRKWWGKPYLRIWNNTTKTSLKASLKKTSTFQPPQYLIKCQAPFLKRKENSLFSHIRFLLHHQLLDRKQKWVTRFSYSHRCKIIAFSDFNTLPVTSLMRDHNCLCSAPRLCTRAYAHRCVSECGRVVHNEMIVFYYYFSEYLDKTKLQMFVFPLVSRWFPQVSCWFQMIFGGFCCFSLVSGWFCFYRFSAPGPG